MAMGLLVGTLNRVLIVEFGVHAWLVALMVSLPLLFAPFRALMGYKSDTHRSAFGWKRVPYIWMGSGLQFGGLAIMPFSLLLLGGDHDGPRLGGQRCRGAGLPDGGRGHADRADRRAGTGRRPRARTCAASRGGADVHDAVGGHGGLRPRLRRAAGQLHAHAAGAGGAGLGRHHAGAEHRCRVEAGATRPGPPQERTRRPGLPRDLGALRQHRPHTALPGRRGLRNHGLQHAGHHPGAVRRRDPEAVGGRHHRADSADGRRRAAGLRPRRAAAGPRHRPQQAGGDGCAGGPAGLQRRDLCRAAAVADAVPRRRHADRLRRRPVLGGHADLRHGAWMPAG